MSLELYSKTSFKISGLITRQYSTSFSWATFFLDKEKRNAIYAIYGFVRLADEIVDTFHGFDKPFLLNKLKEDLYYAIENGISTNPILMSFSETVRKYGITREQIDSFLNSMESDLTKKNYKNQYEINKYVYGSADVVGLMCLKVFCNNNFELYKKLEIPAQKLGSAFQKVNFLRDLRNDIYELNRNYFPEIKDRVFDENSKKNIEKEIEADFTEAYRGICHLPGRAKLAVAIAYFYYKTLFEKIKKAKPDHVLTKRMRISNVRKIFILLKVIILFITNRI
ncbi:phytoene/squalene synthase family protein [Melioribacter sp. OK-6-Me]|uniref:phytoene/squalene synthase family protein n=1 Tax=unclassified Melioribacter TaxID=2627329 RepID=UPI003EDAABA5